MTSNTAPITTTSLQITTSNLTITVNVTNVERSTSESSVVIKSSWTSTKATVVSRVVASVQTLAREQVPGWRAWSDWSACSKSCGGGKMMRVRQCEDKRYCEIDNFEMDEEDCNEWECLTGDWGEWSECEDGWRTRERCDEEWNCELQEEECLDQIAMEYKKEWSEWGKCDNVLGRRTRGRCTEDFGCEEEVEECDRRLTWSEWGPCENGLKVRHKCLDDFCDEEEVQECFANEWGKWGDCSKE